MNFVLISAITLVICMVSLGLVCIHRKKIGKNIKMIAGINVASLFGMLLFTTILLFSGNSVFAADTAGASSSEGLKYIGAALSTGMAAIGSGIAVAMSSSAALGAISEDSKLLGKTLIFVGLSEGIAIYGLIISIMILGA